MTRRSRLLCSVEVAPLLESRVFMSVGGKRGDTSSRVTTTIARVCLTRAWLNGGGCGGRCQGHTYYYYYKLLTAEVNREQSCRRRDSGRWRRSTQA